MAEACTKPATSQHILRQSKVTTGRRFFVEGGDAELHGRRIRDIYDRLVDKLGGEDKIDAGQEVLCRRIATAAEWCERQDSLAAITCSKRSTGRRINP